MKKLLIGIMICSVSTAFAQSDEQIRLSKSTLKVQPRQAALVDQPTIAEKSRETDRSSEVTGVIRVKNGTPFIDIKTSMDEIRMFPVNLPKSAAIDGQTIRFTYTIEDAGYPTGSTKCDHVIRIYDPATVKK